MFYQKALGHWTPTGVAGTDKYKPLHEHPLQKHFNRHQEQEYPSCRLCSLPHQIAEVFATQPAQARHDSGYDSSRHYRVEYRNPGGTQTEPDSQGVNTD